MSKKHKWICPVCGSAKLASSRPRRTATVRYCLACSEQTGSLVERGCPVLDAKRAAKHGTRKKRAKAADERQRERETFAGVHVPDELVRQCRVLVDAGVFPKRMRGGVPLTVRRRSNAGVSGHAKIWSREIVLTIGACSRGRVVELVLHELVHIACPDDEWHGDEFRARLAEGARILWGVVVAKPAARVYSYDDQIATLIDQQETED